MALTIISHTDTGNVEVRYIKVIGNFAYMTQTGAHFHIYDITDVTAPVHVIGLFNTTYLNPAYGFDIKGSYAYVGGEASNKISVIDISVPASASVVASVSNAALRATDVCVVGNYAYGIGSDNIWTIDISNPLAPVYIGALTDATNLHLNDRARAFGTGYLVTNSGAIISLATPSAPTVLTRAGSSYSAGMDLLGNTVVLAGGSSIFVYDITTPSAPVTKAAITDVGHFSLILGCSMVGNNLALVCQTGNSCTVYDLTTLATPTYVDQVIDATYLYHSFSCQIVGNYIHVADAGNGYYTIVGMPGITGGGGGGSSSGKGYRRLRLGSAQALGL